MNREILFRGKRTDNGEWVYGSPLFDCADCSMKCKNQHNGELYLFLGWNDEFHEYDEYDVNPATVGQYTCKMDKNGKDIYEGDILAGKGIKGKRDYFEVWWSDAGCGFVCGRGKKIFPHMNQATMDHYEVVGNIHDNPELLGGNDGTIDMET